MFFENGKKWQGFSSFFDGSLGVVQKLFFFVARRFVVDVSNLNVNMFHIFNSKPIF